MAPLLIRSKSALSRPNLPFGKGKRLLNRGGVWSALTGGWQINAVLAAFSGSPFTISASTASLNAPGSPQLADQVRSTVKVLGGVGQPAGCGIGFRSRDFRGCGSALSIIRRQRG
jgi:hypothetical protein